MNAATLWTRKTGLLWRVDHYREYPGNSGTTHYISNQWVSFSSHAGSYTSNNTIVTVTGSGGTSCRFSTTGFHGPNLLNLLHYHTQRCGVR